MQKENTTATRAAVFLHLKYSTKMIIHKIPIAVNNLPPLPNITLCHPKALLFIYQNNSPKSANIISDGGIRS